MAIFLVRNIHQKHICYDQIELCVQNMDNAMGLSMSIIGRVYISYGKKENIHFDFLECLFSNFNLKTCNDDLHHCSLDQSILSGIQQSKLYPGLEDSTVDNILDLQLNQGCFIEEHLIMELHVHDWRYCHHNFRYTGTCM